MEWAVWRVSPVQMLCLMLSCTLSESSEHNYNHIVHFWCVSPSLQQLERSYSITVFSRTLELQEEITNVDMSVASVSWHSTSFHIVKDSSPGVLLCLAFFSIVVWDSTGVLQTHQTFFANISHQVSMLLPCSRHCGKGKVQANGLLPKSKVFCSWVYQNTNVANTSKWRNYMRCMEVHVEGVLNWEPAKGTEVICLFLLSSFNPPSALGLFLFVCLFPCPSHGAHGCFLISYNLKVTPPSLPLK